MMKSEDFRDFVNLYGYVFDRKDGDKGVVFSYHAIDELKKIYNDVDQRIKDGTMTVYDMIDYEYNGNIYIIRKGE